MKKTTNLSLSTATGEDFKKQLIKIYGIEFQKEIIPNNNQLHFILITQIDKTSICQQLLDLIHLLKHLAILKLQIKLSLFQDFMGIQILKPNLTETLSEKRMDKIIYKEILTQLENQQ